MAQLKGKVVLAKISETGRMVEICLREKHLAEEDGFRYRMDINGQPGLGWAATYKDAKELFRQYA